MPRWHFDSGSPFEVTNGQGQGGNSTYAAGATSTYKFTQQELESNLDGYWTYLRGLKIKLAPNIDTAANASAADFYWAMMDNVINFMEINIAGVQKRGHWRAWMKRCENWTGMRRYTHMPNSLDDSALEKWFYVPLNAPGLTAFPGDFDFPISMLAGKDFLKIEYGNATAGTGWPADHVLNSMTVYVYPDIVVKPALKIPFMENFYYEEKPDGTYTIEQGRSLYTHVNLINRSLATDDGAFTANCNEYATVEGKVDGRHFIEAAYPADMLRHWAFKHANSGQGVKIEEVTLGTDTWRGVMEANGNELEDINALGENYVQEIYNVPARGKVSYALASRKNLKFQLPNPTSNTDSEYHHMVYSRLIPNKEIDELNKRIIAAGGTIPSSPAWAGYDSKDNWNIFAPYTIGG